MLDRRVENEVLVEAGKGKRIRQQRKMRDPPAGDGPDDAITARSTSAPYLESVRFIKARIARKAIASAS